MTTIEDVTTVLNDYLLSRRMVVLGREFIPFQKSLTPKQAEHIINEVMMREVAAQLNAEVE